VIGARKTPKRLAQLARINLGPRASLTRSTIQSGKQLGPKIFDSWHGG
jgi:hypothetical protein